MEDNVILNAALCVFSQKGYKNATTRAITAEAGVHESTLFRKFKSKENLFNTVIKYNHDKIINDLNLCLSKNDIEDPKEKLDYSLSVLYKIIKNNGAFVKIVMCEKDKISNGDFSIPNDILPFLKSIKPQGTEVNLHIFTMNIMSFFLFVVYEQLMGTVEVSEEAIINEFKEYCARILQI